MCIKKVLVIGTTSDYIEWIRRSCPGRAIFVTAPEIRESSKEDGPAAGEEILIPLYKYALVLDAVKQHLDKWRYEVDAIFCFDCECMELTAFIAGQLQLDYPSEKAIQNCRDKYLSKQIWQQNNILCPRMSPVNTASEAIKFFKATQGAVLKPIAGSGSELVFKCMSPSDCQSAFEIIQSGLKKRGQHPLFKRSSSIEHLMLAEEVILGTEYSCDFTVENGEVYIIRLAKKIKHPSKPFGTIWGYLIPAILPPSVSQEDLHQTLLKSATVLGIYRGLCMVDFIISDQQIYLIELTPRPGGDCLPHLLKACADLDMMKLSLDFAQKCPIGMNKNNMFTLHIGIRLHANKSGILKKIETHDLTADERVKDILVNKKPGHQITMPPDDYDSWCLGHIIFEPSGDKFPESQAFAVSKRMEILIESNLQEAS